GIIERTNGAVPRHVETAKYHVAHDIAPVPPRTTDATITVARHPVQRKHTTGPAGPIPIRPRPANRRRMYGHAREDVPSESSGQSCRRNLFGCDRLAPEHRASRSA